MTASPPASGAIRIALLDAATLPPAVVMRPIGFPHELIVYERSTEQQVAERIRTADIVITNKAPVRAPVAAPGYDIVDVAQCTSRGIVVCNVRDYASVTVPEHCFALILALRRNLLAYHRSIAQGAWQRSEQFSYFDYPIRDLAGSTLGIIGRGVLGRAVADLGRALGMRVVFAASAERADPDPLARPFDDVLRHSDVLTLHCPLNGQTRNMIGPKQFALMQKRPLLINTARGGLVDELALCRALEEGQISGAGFDVTTTEPPPPDHPFMRLLDRPDFILTPHVAWSSVEATQALADQLVETINRFLLGSPRNVVTG